MIFIMMCSCASERPPATSYDARPVDVSAPAEKVSPPTGERGFHKGVSLGLFVSHPDAEYQLMLYGQMLDEIAAIGATDVQIPIRWAQRDVHADALAPRRGLTPSDEVLAGVIAEARRRALRVFLMPVIHLEDRSDGAWRGKLAPRDPEAWWASYGRFVGHYAELGRGHRAHMLAVGSELVSMERFEDRWRALIADVRARFPGKLTYSANWDHFEPVPFWDALDVVGVTAYQPLMKQPATPGAPPTVETLARGWRPFTQKLRGWARRSGRRYILTEVGYPAHTHGAARPWDYRPRGVVAPELQARCFEATAQAWRGDERLDGVFVWNWFGVGGERDRGYALRGRRAEAVVKGWFSTR